MKPLAVVVLVLGTLSVAGFGIWHKPSRVDRWIAVSVVGFTVGAMTLAALELVWP
jgi:hypothetical protein